MKKSYWSIIFFALIAILAVLFIASGEPGQQAERPEKLKIGSIVGLTGEYAGVGRNWANGIALAHKQYEATNPDMEVEIIQEDSEFNTKTGVTAYKKLENVNNIDALINFGTFTLDGIYDLVTEKPYPVIQGGSQSSAPSDDNVIRIQPGNVPAQRALGEYASQQGYDNAVIFYTDQSAFQKFFEAVRDGFKGTAKSFALSPDKKTGFQTQVTKALSENPGAVFLVTLPQQGAAITSEILEQTENSPRIFHDANFQTGFSDYKRLLGSEFSELQDDVFLKMVSNTRDEFIQAYKEEYGKEPGALADVGYDAFNLLVKNYSPDSEEWIENIKNAEFEGASGKVSFNEVGVRKPEFEIVTLGEDLKL
ncbi:MAG: ABC transporter substrate-binding protein [Candidatus Magasanikbacteria bacterium]